MKNYDIVNCPACSNDIDITELEEPINIDWKEKGSGIAVIECPYCSYVFDWWFDVQIETEILLKPTGRLIKDTELLINDMLFEGKAGMVFLFKAGVTYINKKGHYAFRYSKGYVACDLIEIIREGKKYEH